jgi:hypothetical protein
MVAIRSCISPYNLGFFLTCDKATRPCGSATCRNMLAALGKLLARIEVSAHSFTQETE